MNELARNGVLHWVVAGTVAVIVAALGGALTDLGPWYVALRKPSWQPPDWLFGPAWTLIFACATVAAVWGWRSMPSRSARAALVALFLLNAALNVFWSLLFFRTHRPDRALIEVVALWGSIVALIAMLWPHSRAAAGMLVPYVAWVSFAACLNFTIVQLNRPFHAG